MSECTMLGCQRVTVAKGLCQMHYRRMERHGDPLKGRPAHWGKAEKHPLWHSHQWFKRHKALCEEWQEFWVFVAAIGEKREGHNLRRKDKTLPLSQSNWYWKQTISNTDKANYQRQWRAANSYTAKGYDLKRQFGLSITSYEALLSSQNGVCAICHKPDSTYEHLAVDHCHTTHKVRGLLCNKCNRGLGYFKDDVQALTNAVSYLTRQPD